MSKSIEGAMVEAKISPDMMIDEIVAKYPGTAKVFLKHRLFCVGCPISRHHTVQDVANENALDIQALIAELVEAADSGQQKRLE